MQKKNMSSGRGYTRANKGRFMLYFACLLGGLGLMAIYHNTLTQLDLMKHSNEQCHQQQESLSAQLQIIFEYKTKLEKSVKLEQTEHQKTRTDMQKKMDNEKMKWERSMNEANNRYNSLQQRYKGLQSELDELKDTIESQKTQIENEKQLRIEAERVKDECETSKNSVQSKFMAVLAANDHVKEQLEQVKFNKQESNSQINHLLKTKQQLEWQLKHPDDAQLKHQKEENEKSVIAQPPSSILKANGSTSTTSTQSSVQGRDNARNRLAVPIAGPNSEDPRRANENNPGENVLAIPKYIESRKKHENVPSGIVRVSEESNVPGNVNNYDQNNRGNAIAQANKVIDQNYNGPLAIEDIHGGNAVEDNLIKNDKAQHIDLLNNAHRGIAADPVEVGDGDKKAFGQYDYEKDKDLREEIEEDDAEGEEYAHLVARQNDPANRT